MPKAVASIGCAALALTLLVASVAGALADKPATAVTVVNPGTAPVPTAVVNPATNPALTSSVDDPGRAAYQSTIFLLTSQCRAPNDCLAEFANVPAQHRLVVQHVSGTWTAASVPSGAAVQLTGGITNTNIYFLAPFSGTLGAFDQPVLYYVDGGIAPIVDLFLTGANFVSSFTLQLTLTGYLLDCTISPCAPIAH